MLVAERGRFIGDRLRTLREDRALTQYELSQLAGVHYGSVSELESNKRRAFPKTVRKLAAGLGVEVHELTGGPARPEVRPPDKPGLTEENTSKIEAKKREKEERDEQTRRERDAHDTGDRTL